MVELGTKFGYKAYHSEGIRRLEHHFPTKLADFDHTWIDTHNVSSTSDGCLIKDLRKEHAIAVVNIVHRYDIEKMLPSAFYVCAQMDLIGLKGGMQIREGAMMEQLSRGMFGLAWKGLKS